MKASTKLRALSSVMALSCLTLLLPQQARATVTLSGCGGGDFGNACSLSELLAGGSIRIFDTQFSNFGISLIGGRALSTAVIRVDPIDQLSTPGFTLVDTGGTLNTVNGDETFSELSFSAAVLANNTRITGGSVSMQLGNITGDNSFAQVFATLFDSTLTNALGLPSVFCDAATTPVCANSTVADSASFTPVTALAVPAADVNLVSDASGVARINAVTVQLTQIPEPGSLALLTLAVAGMGLSYRRRPDDRA